MSDSNTVNFIGCINPNNIGVNNGKINIALKSISKDQNLASTLVQIQESIEQLQKQGITFNAALELLQQQEAITFDTALEQLANTLANEAKQNPTFKDSALKWGQSLGSATLTDVFKGFVKLAIRSTGIPLP
jgi:hypothetical protein